VTPDARGRTGCSPGLAICLTGCSDRAPAARRVCVVPVASADVAAPVAPAHAAPHVAAAVEPAVSPVAVVDHDGPTPAPAPSIDPSS
jgi:hypothetical protein